MSLSAPVFTQHFDNIDTPTGGHAKPASAPQRILARNAAPTPHLSHRPRRRPRPRPRRRHCSSHPVIVPPPPPSPPPPPPPPLLPLTSLTCVDNVRHVGSGLRLGKHRIQAGNWKRFIKGSLLVYNRGGRTIRYFWAHVADPLPYLCELLTLTELLVMVIRL